MDSYIRKLARSLRTAVENNNLIEVETLLSIKGIDVNLCNPYDIPCLALAIKNNYYEIVKKLLTFKGTDLNAKTCFGNTMLDIAVSYGYSEIAILLVRHGVNLDSLTFKCSADLYQKLKVNQLKYLQDIIQRGLNLQEILTIRNGVNLIYDLANIIREYDGCEMKKIKEIITWIPTDIE